MCISSSVGLLKEENIKLILEKRDLKVKVFRIERVITDVHF